MVYFADKQRGFEVKCNDFNPTQSYPKFGITQNCFFSSANVTRLLTAMPIPTKPCDPITLHRGLNFITVCVMLSASLVVPHIFQLCVTSGWKVKKWYQGLIPLVVPWKFKVCSKWFSLLIMPHQTFRSQPPKMSAQSPHSHGWLADNWHTGWYIWQSWQLSRYSAELRVLLYHRYHSLYMKDHHFAI